jgi:hypothetical protein
MLAKTRSPRLAKAIDVNKPNPVLHPVTSTFTVSPLPFEVAPLCIVRKRGGRRRMSIGRAGRGVLTLASQAAKPAEPRYLKKTAQLGGAWQPMDHE